LLDLGCSVGRTSFELADTFSFIDAIDFSARYIRYGVQLQRGDNIRFINQKEGELFDFNEINLNKLDLPEAKNILFSQGDASNLKSTFNQYDVVLAQNILEKNHQPKLFLTTINKRINDKGLLILVSDYSFNEDKTTKSQWLGGIKVNGENVTGFDGITEVLTDKFNLLEYQDLLRMLPINQRNFDASMMHLTVWQKK
jgi:putative 4-mercaptohistidine N1-methyltranferase